MLSSKKYTDIHVTFIRLKEKTNSTAFETPQPFCLATCQPSFYVKMSPATQVLIRKSPCSIFHHGDPFDPKTNTNLSLLTPSRRVYYIFSGPPYGIILSDNSEKISSH